jgi:flagellar biosynthetic protein FlhB
MAGLFEGNQDDKTESASSYRREEFRKQGSVALSREVLSIALLLAVGFGFQFAFAGFPQAFGQLLEHFFRFEHVKPLSRETVVESLQFAGTWWVKAVAPIFIVAIIGAFVASVAQVGWYVTFEPLSPNLDRINPLNGIKKLFSSQGVMEAAKSLVKIGLGVWVTWIFFKGQVGNAPLFFQKTAGEGLVLTLSTVSKLFFSLVMTFAVLAVADYAWARYRLEQQMKVSKREAKEEFKMREGDPMIRSRIRGIQRRIASRRMMDAVPKADVIVTNPTHLAVALVYDAALGPPKVVAKGADHLAKKIREVARAHGIPIVENKPLARTLYKTIEIGHFIPRELYKAVAQVLGYVYRLKGRTV